MLSYLYFLFWARCAKKYHGFIILSNCMSLSFLEEPCHRSFFRNQLLFDKQISKSISKSHDFVKRVTWMLHKEMSCILVLHITSQTHVSKSTFICSLCKQNALTTVVNLTKTYIRPSRVKNYKRKMSTLVPCYSYFFL